MIAALLVAAAGVCPLAAADAPAPSGIAWAKDWKTAQKRARATARPLLVDFWAEWCRWCHELDRTTYVDPDVVALAHGFVAVKVNAEGSLGEVELTRRYQVDALPTMAFVSARGRLLVRRTSYEDAAAFAETLKTAARVAAEAAPLEAALEKAAKDPAALAALGALLFDQQLLADAELLLAKARPLDQARPLDERRRTRTMLAQIARARGRLEDVSKLRAEAEALGPKG